MKNFLLKLSFFIILVISVDVIIGSSMDFMVKNISVGTRGRDNYICDKSNDEILIFGSSRAAHHYNSCMIEDSLEMTCFNCGEDGDGIFLGYGRLLMNKERHQPKIIIYDVTPEFDIELCDNSRFLSWLKSRYQREGINHIIDDIDKTEKYKLLSGMYRYNSVFLQNIFTYLTSISSYTGEKGFRPLKGNFDGIEKNNNKFIPQEDPLKIRYIHKFINASEGSFVFFVLSPVWYGLDSSRVSTIKSICDSSKVFFIDFSNDAKYVHNDYYFKDGYHLNESGANVFTSDLISSIKDKVCE